jgi:hypothetical protein
MQCCRIIEKIANNSAITYAFSTFTDDLSFNPLINDYREYVFFVLYAENPIIKKNVIYADSFREIAKLDYELLPEYLWYSGTNQIRFILDRGEIVNYIGIINENQIDQLYYLCNYKNQKLLDKKKYEINQLKTSERQKNDIIPHTNNNNNNNVSGCGLQIAHIPSVVEFNLSPTQHNSLFNAHRAIDSQNLPSIAFIKFINNNKYNFVMNAKEIIKKYHDRLIVCGTFYVMHCQMKTIFGNDYLKEFLCIKK